MIIHRFDNAPLMNPERSADLVLNAVPVGDCITATTPVCLAKLYGIPTAPATVSTNKLGVSGFANNFANQADLNVSCRPITKSSLHH